MIIILIKNDNDNTKQSDCHSFNDVNGVSLRLALDHHEVGIAEANEEEKYVSECQASSTS